MLKITCKYVLLLLFLIVPSQSFATEVSNSLEYSLLPSAGVEIDYEQQNGYKVLIRSEKSTDSLGRPFNIKWSIYQIHKTGIPQKLSSQFWGNAYSDEEISSIFDTMPAGIYGIVLTATNADNVSNSSEKLVYIKGQSPRKYSFIAKKALKALISSLRSGSAKWMLPSSVYSKIDKYIIPPLERLLGYTEVYGQNVVGALIDGLMAAGVKYSTARRVAEMIVAVLL